MSNIDKLAFDSMLSATAADNTRVALALQSGVEETDTPFTVDDELVQQIIEGMMPAGRIGKGLQAIGKLSKSLNPNIFLKAGERIANLFLKSKSGKGLKNKGLQEWKNNFVKNSGYSDTKVSNMAREIKSIAGHKSAKTSSAKKKIEQIINKDWGNPEK